MNKFGSLNYISAKSMLPLALSVESYVDWSLVLIGVLFLKEKSIQSPTKLHRLLGGAWLCFLIYLVKRVLNSGPRPSRSLRYYP
jgi:hypothetical protein